jgi:DNA polymerase-3 subunit epsilon
MGGGLLGWLRGGRDDGASAPSPGGSRWLVVDVETSGLDPRHDRLLAIAAVALEATPTRAFVRPGDSFEQLLRQPAPPAPLADADKANILVHGIGVGAQQVGLAPAQALAEFHRYVDGAPLVGYHVAFDRAVIERAAQPHGHDFGARWADLAEVGPALWPDALPQSLDAWLAHHGIPCLARHQAAADALATAELLQCWWPRLAREGAWRFDAFRKLAESRRWLGR